jgi:hypothetical protein
MTPAGEQAEQIAQWAWDDPANRVADAQQRVTALYQSSADPVEQAEISGVATMLSRLASSLVHDGGGGIFDQLQGSV